MAVFRLFPARGYCSISLDVGFVIYFAFHLLGVNHKKDLGLIMRTQLDNASFGVQHFRSVFFRQERNMSFEFSIVPLRLENRLDGVMWLGEFFSLPLHNGLKALVIKIAYNNI